MRYNFNTNSATHINDGIGYDYDSIMHYGPKAFSIDGSYTILAKNGQAIGQRQGLSVKDVQQAKQLYCTTQTTGGGNGM